jgi:hypothetical protein
MLFPESELDGKGSPRSHLARRWRTETIVSIEHKLWPTNCVPFGIGAAEHALRFRVGDRESVYDYELEINDFGDGAVSELPNQN